MNRVPHFSLWSGIGTPLASIVHRLRLVGDDDLRAGARNPDHLFDGTLLVGKEIDSAYMEDAIKDLRPERQPTGFALEEAA